MHSELNQESWMVFMNGVIQLNIKTVFIYIYIASVVVNVKKSGGKKQQTWKNSMNMRKQMPLSFLQKLS